MVESAAGWPPGLIAIFALVIGGIWLATGTALVERLLPRTLALDPAWRWLVAAFSFVPLCGALVIALALSGAATRPVLLGLALATFAGGISPLRRLVTGQLAKRGLRAKHAPRPRWEVWLSSFVLIALMLTALYAGHPQRLYDHVNYHLVMAKYLLLFDRPFDAIYDSHLVICGLLEYALAVPASLLPNDFFIVGLGQSVVFLQTGFIFLGSLILLLRARSRISAKDAALLATIAFVSFIPNGEIIRIGKPDAMLLSGTVLLLGLMIAQAGTKSLWVAMSMIVLMGGIKMTFLHAALAIAPLLLWTNHRRLRWPSRGERVLVMTSLLILLVVLGKNFILAGSPLYPADSGWRPGPLSDALTKEYWDQVAFSGSPSLPEAWKGPLVLIGRNLGLALALALAVFGTAYSYRSRAKQAFEEGVGLLVGFVGLYTLLWPIFYRPDIFSRFVAPASAALICLLCLLLARLTSPRSAIAGACLLGLSFGGMEVMAYKIWMWNHGSAHQAMVLQFPLVEALTLINERVHGQDHLVLSDDSNKMFLDVPAIYSLITPREREIWNDLTFDPLAGANKHHVAALVRKKGSPAPVNEWHGDMRPIWQSLKDHGQVVETSDHEVLFLNRL